MHKGSYQIILALYLTFLNVNGILLVDLFYIQPNGKWRRFNEYKIGLDAKSWDDQSIKEAAVLIKEGPKLDCTCSLLILEIAGYRY